MSRSRSQSGFSRSEESRASFQNEFGVRSTPDLATLLADPQIMGVILTVPNEQHLPLAREVAKAGKPLPGLELAVFCQPINPIAAGWCRKSLYFHGLYP